MALIREDFKPEHREPVAEYTTEKVNITQVIQWKSWRGKPSNNPQVIPTDLYTELQKPEMAHLTEPTVAKVEAKVVEPLATNQIITDPKMAQVATEDSASVSVPVAQKTSSTTTKKVAE